MNIKQDIKTQRDSIKYNQEALRRFRQEANFLLEKKLDLTTVSSMSVNAFSVYFYINDEANREDAQKFVHSVVAAYELKRFEKKPNWDGESLICRGYDQSGRGIEVRGYVPPTCHIEEFETEAEPWEIENAKKTLERAQTLLAAGKKLSKRVVCQ